MNDAIRAAYEAGKSAERFFDGNVGRMPEEPVRGKGAGDGGKRAEQDWHH